MAETYRALDKSVAALGKPIRVHPRKQRMGGAPFVFAFGAAVLAWIATGSRPALIGAAAVLSLLAIAFGIGWLVDRTNMRRASAATIHEHGLRLHRLGGSDVVPWSEITSLQFEREKRMREEPEVLYLPGVLIAGSKSEWYWVCRVRVGHEVVFEASDAYDGGLALVSALQDAVADREVPRALDRIREGGAVSFGPVSLRAEALVVRDVSVPWSELAGARVEGSRLVFFDGDDERRADVAVKDVPNPHVVIRVAGELSGA